jgi:hypothetical protein
MNFIVCLFSGRFSLLFPARSCAGPSGRFAARSPLHATLYCVQNALGARRFAGFMGGLHMHVVPDQERTTSLFFCPSHCLRT